MFFRFAPPSVTFHSDPLCLRLCATYCVIGQNCGFDYVGKQLKSTDLISLSFSAEEQMCDNVKKYSFFQIVPAKLLKIVK